jgi:catalase
MGVDGLITTPSNYGPEETMNRVEAEVKAHGMTVFARVNHSELAKQAGLELSPTELILFGNPRGGTPLMQAKQTIGIDLPLKALVWQDAAGKTWVSYNDATWLAKRHEVAGAEGIIDAMGQALSDIAAKATREPGRDNHEIKSSAAEAEKARTAGSGKTQVVEPSIPPAKSPKSGLISGLVVMGGIVGCVAGLFAYAGGWRTPRAITPARIADGFQQVNGIQPGFRRNHAKGVCVSGYFDSNGRGAAFSKAAVFRSGRASVIGRFSLSGGQPFAADDPHTVRGLGLRFTPANGEEWRTAMINLPVFPFRTPGAFYEQLLATTPDPATGKPVPGKMTAFLAKHPESAKAIEFIHSLPMSSGFENSTFNSLNTFRIIDSAGSVTWVRWSMVPVQPLEPSTTADSGQGAQNQLFDALIASIHRHRLEWHLVITIAQPGDPTDDATRPWPADREQVNAGTLIIDHVESDDISPARDINFDPLVLPSGIAASDDPLLSARSAVYSQSFTRREGEHKQPAAISVAETEK